MRLDVLAPEGPAESLTWDEMHERFATRSTRTAIRVRSLTPGAFIGHIGQDGARLVVILTDLQRGSLRGVDKINPELWSNPVFFRVESVKHDARVEESVQA